MRACVRAPLSNGIQSCRCGVGEPGQGRDRKSRREAGWPRGPVSEEEWPEMQGLGAHPQGRSHRLSEAQHAAARRGAASRSPGIHGIRAGNIAQRKV